ncbi:hypothetical protein [Streptomyces sp. NPDC101181]|uniref:hypothetical protein n=1 Tax=Streptomyces sp. NPDC101181 TaxID=3366125 RepID=UPI003807B30C
MTFSALPSLRELSLSRLHWRDLSPLAGLGGLQHLRLENFDDLTDISTLTGLPELSELLLGHLHSFTELGPLLDIPSLRRLNKSPQMNAEILMGRRDPVLVELANREVAIDRR